MHVFRRRLPCLMKEALWGDACNGFSATQVVHSQVLAVDEYISTYSDF